MAKNDAILLEGIVQDKMSVEALDKGAAFELFAFEQILKTYDLTRDEIDFGWVDGRDDGGIDGFYVFINGILLQNTQGYLWPKRNAYIDIWIISCKHHDTFKQSTLNTLLPSIEELFDFSKEPSQFEGKYSDKIIKARGIAVQAFLRTASGLPILNFHFAYAARGDATEIEENVKARGNQIKRIVTDYFSASDVDFNYYDAAHLIELHRKNRVILELPYVEQLCREQGAFVLLVPLHTYAKFVTDEYGQLRRYLFDSNVRDFLGDNRVNQDIFNSLINTESPDFWWLNNGITLLATSAVPLGKTLLGNTIQLHDVQIVNGLQTTQSIYNYFKVPSANSTDRCVLIKVIVSENEAVRDAIIQATNNQSPVELASLTATDKIQRDIEEILERHGLYYERRKNYYKNIGKPIERFVTPIQLSVAFIAVVRKSAQKAGSLKTKFMRNPISYESIFSEKTPIALWPKLAEIIKAVEAGLIIKMPKRGFHENRTIGKWRGAVALCSIATLNNSFNYTVESILKTDISLITPNLIESIFFSLKEISKTKIKNSKNLDVICSHYGNNKGIKGTSTIGKWQLPTGSEHKAIKKFETNNVLQSPSVAFDDIVLKVAEHLPVQPWPPGIHADIGNTINVDKKIVYKAIQKLIATGSYHNQVDGVVINENGIIVSVDSTRAEKKYVVGDLYKKT